MQGGDGEGSDLPRKKQIWNPYIFFEGIRKGGLRGLKTSLCCFSLFAFFFFWGGGRGEKLREILLGVVHICFFLESVKILAPPT